MSGAKCVGVEQTSVGGRNSPASDAVGGIRAAEYSSDSMNRDKTFSLYFSDGNTSGAYRHLPVSLSHQEKAQVRDSQYTPTAIP